MCKLLSGNNARTAGISTTLPAACESPARQTYQIPLHSLCKMVQLKGIDLQVNAVVVICERMVFDFNWLLQCNHCGCNQGSSGGSTTQQSAPIRFSSLVNREFAYSASQSDN